MLLKKMFVADLSIIVDEEKGASDQLMRGEEWRTDATILDQLQTVQEHVLEIGKLYFRMIVQDYLNKIYKEIFLKHLIDIDDQLTSPLTLLRRWPMKVRRTFETWSLVQVAL